MSTNERPSGREILQKANLQMTHEACGGRADLVISQGLGNVTYSVHCHDCGYVETWSPDPAADPKIQ